MRISKGARPSGRCYARFFTMVEMIAVIAIIFVLVGLSIGAYNGIQRGRARTTTEARLTAIHGALQAFKTKYGYFPQTDEKYLAVVVTQGLPNTGIENLNKDFVSGKYLVFGADFYKLLPTEIIKTATSDGQLNSQDILIIPDGYKEPLKEKPENIKNSAKISLIYYRCPGKYSPDSYDLFSAGPDRDFNDSKGDLDKDEDKDNIWPTGLKKVSGTK